MSVENKFLVFTPKVKTNFSKSTITPSMHSIGELRVDFVNFWDQKVDRYSVSFLNMSAAESHGATLM